MRKSLPDADTLIIKKIKQGEKSLDEKKPLKYGAFFIVFAK